MRSLLLILALACIASHSASSQRIIGCAWDASTSISQINANLCTHAFFYHYSPDSKSTLTTEHQDKVESFLALKQQNPSIKLLVSIGVAETLGFAYSWSVSLLKDQFIANIMDLVMKTGFDGVDFDWRHPSTSDRDYFEKMLSELKPLLVANGKLLSITRTGDMGKGFDGYTPKALNTADFVNIMLYGIDEYNGNTDLNSGYWTAEYALDDAIQWGKIPANKVTLGLAGFGKIYGLIDPRNPSVGVPYNYAKEVSYRTICSELKKPGWTTMRQDETPFSYNGAEWISYDDVRSINSKLSLFWSKGLAGIHFATTDQDDYDGTCGDGPFPLLKAAHYAIINDQYIPPPTLFTTPAPTTAAPSFSCHANGFYSHPDCTKFYQCVFGYSIPLECPFNFGWFDFNKMCTEKTNLLNCQ